MSYQRGWQALNLEMPETIPHTEYVSHPGLVRKVSGIDPDDPLRGHLAYPEMVRLLDYDLLWHADGPDVVGRQTNMGHAIWYEAQHFWDDRTCPFENEEEVLSFDPVEEFGLPDLKETTYRYRRQFRELCGTYPTCVVPGGHYKTIFSWCLMTFGWDMFLRSAPLDYERFDRVLEGFFQMSLVGYQAWANTDIKAFICHDDIVWTQGAVFSPAWYRRYVFPRYRKLWAPLREKGIIVLFCSDGDFTEFVDDLVDAGADGFIFEPLTSLELIVERYGQTKVIVGNVDTRILTFGTPEEIRAEVKRCADIGRPCPGYFFAVGNHIPHNVPLESVEVYLEAIREMGRR